MKPIAHLLRDLPLTNHFVALEAGPTVLEEPYEPSSQAFPVNALSPSMATMAVAVARAERVPLSLPALCTLGVVSAAVGAGLEVRSGPNRFTRANLFLLGSAESGSGKSQVFNHVFRPIFESQKQLDDDHEFRTLPSLRAELADLDRRIRKLGKASSKAGGNTEFRELYLQEQLARKQLPGPSLAVADITSEKLVSVLAANRETLFSASPEARQIVEIVCGRYTSSRSPDVGVYLCGFSGDPLPVDRVTRDTPKLSRPCLSILWLVQPDILERLFGQESLVVSGFMPRFLVCHTNATPQRIVPGEDYQISDSTCADWASQIKHLLKTYHSEEKPFQIEPSSGAKALLDGFYNAIVDRRAADLADLPCFASRHAEQAWRVALTLHAALHGSDSHHHHLGEEVAANAIEVVNWFIGQQLGILVGSQAEAKRKLEGKVLQLLHDRANGRRLEGFERCQAQSCGFVTARTVHRARITSSSDAAARLLAGMEAEGVLVGHDAIPQGGGRATRRFYQPEQLKAVFLQSRRGH